MKIDAGRFRHVVNIEVLGSGSPDGFGNTIQQWVTLYYQIPVEIVPLSSRELFAGQQNKSTATHRVYMRYATGITGQARINYDGRIFTLTGNPINPEERNIALELTCQEEVQ